MKQAPAFVRWSNPIMRRLLGVGVPMGPNGLLTVRGRTSGVPRTTPVGVLEVNGRRWIIGPYGEVHWVRNLREAREGVIKIGKKSESVRAVELTRDEADVFFRDVLRPFFARQAFILRLGLRPLFRDILAHPETAAGRCPVFELHADSAKSP